MITLLLVLRVLHVDWPSRIVNVEPTAEVGRSRWFGSSRALHAEAARAVEEVLASGDAGVSLSSRATLSLQGLREEMPYLDGDVLPIVTAGAETRIWTFAGGRANVMLSSPLQATGASLRHGLETMNKRLKAIEAKSARHRSSRWRRPKPRRRPVASLKASRPIPFKLPT
jgi:hypothetical protein